MSHLSGQCVLKWKKHEGLIPAESHAAYSIHGDFFFPSIENLSIGQIHPGMTTL